jgi:hypothetical protein
MPSNALIGRAIKLALESIQPTTTLAPGARRKQTGPNVALRRCCAAWKRAFDAYMEENDGDPNDSGDRIFASNQAAVSYRNAMPLLAGYEGVRDFLACVAHGILIGAILKEEGGQLLYAAQVALNLAQCERRMADTTPQNQPNSASE